MRVIQQISFIILWMNITATWHFINRIDQEQKVKQECIQYLVDSNVHAGNLVMIVLSPATSYNSFIRNTMARTNVVVVHPDPVNPFTQKPIRRYPIKNDISNDFQHKFGIVGSYIIETSLFMMDHVIEFISRTDGYNSRANFILIITDGSTEITSSRPASVQTPATSSSSPSPLPIHRASFRNETGNRINDDNGTSNGTEQHVSLQQTFRSLWRFYIFNSIVMICDESNLKVCSVYTWFPFEKGSQCGNNTGNFLRIDECVSMVSGNMSCLYVHYGADHHLHHRHFSVHKKNDFAIRLESVHHSKTGSADEHAMDHLSTINNETMQQEGQQFHTQPINNCHNKPRVVLTVPQLPSPPASFHYPHRPWDEKYTKQFFTSNYKPYGLIEFRQWATENVDMNDSTSLDEYQLFSTLSNGNDGCEQRTIPNTLTPHFYEKIPSNLHGCEFHALLFIWPPFVTSPTATFYGLEHKLMLDVSRFMNFRMLEKYIEIQNIAQSNTKSDQLYQMLLDSQAVLAFGNVYPNTRMHRKIDHSIGYLYDLINWVVPLAANKPSWLNLVNCFR